MIIFLKNRKGFSLVEIILAIALFAIFSVGLMGLLFASYGSDVQAEEREVATIYAEEGIQAALSIRRQAWNLLVNGSYGLDNSNGYWEFLGSSESLEEGKYTRVITIADVCRDGADDIISCIDPGAVLDLYTKQITSTISYDSINGIANEINLISYATNWQSYGWTQTDWVGGSGQATWSSDTSYDSDDGNVFVSTIGQVTLAQTGSSDACGDYDWPFTVSGNYVFDSNLIEVTGGAAQLASGSSEYSIDDVLIDSWEFNASNGEAPSVIHVSGDIYAVVYQGPGDDGFVDTFSINSAGTITKSIIDSLEFDTSFAFEMNVIHVSGDVYAVTYQGPGTDGYVKTFTINSVGAISDSTIDVLDFDTVVAYDPRLVHVSGDVYAAVYEGIDRDGFMATFTINSSGVISNSVIDSLEFDANNGEKPEIINISGDVFAIVYDGNGTIGTVLTLTIDSSGNIGSIVDSFVFDVLAGTEPEIINISGDVFAIVYEGPGADGWLKTLTIDSSGNIGASIIDSLEFDTSQGGEPDIISISDNSYLISYTGPGTDGWAATVTIETDGQIGASVLDSLEFDASNGEFSNLIQLSTTDYAIFYEGSAADGWVVTIGLSSSATYSSDNPSINPTATHSVASLDVWTSFAETATKNSGEIYYQLSDDGGVWYYWNGSFWGIASACDGVTNNCNTASEINTNIQTFPTSTKAISFRAFLESDGATQVQLDNVQVSCAQGYDWTFDSDADYTFDSNDIEVTGGVAQLVGSGSLESGSTSNSDFEGGFSPWSYSDWDQNGGEVDVQGGLRNSGGNPGRYAYVNVPSGRNDELGAYEYQSFTTTVDNPTVEIDLDYIITAYDPTPNAFEVYIFVDSTSGAPTIGQEVWSSGTISGTSGWTTVPTIDASSAVTSAGTYYLKMAVWVETPNGNTGPFEVGFDNVVLNWSGLSGGGYPSTNPTITPASDLSVSSIKQWNSFTETATKNGGEIYYQLSDNAGATWRYWDGAAWSNVSLATDYNTASVVDTNISEFPTTTQSIMFKAFLSSDGTQQVSLDNVNLYWGEDSGGGGGNYQTSGYLVSSAFDTGSSSSFNSLSWSDTTPVCTPSCGIQVQVRTAPDSGGSPGTWTSWYGSSGSGSYFTSSSTTLLSTDLNYNQWVQYRVELAGDGSDTPIFESININYTP